MWSKQTYIQSKPSSVNQLICWIKIIRLWWKSPNVKNYRADLSLSCTCLVVVLYLSLVADIVCVGVWRETNITLLSLQASHTARNWVSRTCVCVSVSSRRSQRSILPRDCASAYSCFPSSLPVCVIRVRSSGEIRQGSGTTHLPGSPALSKQVPVKR